MSRLRHPLLRAVSGITTVAFALSSAAAVTLTGNAAFAQAPGRPPAAAPEIHICGIMPELPGVTAAVQQRYANQRTAPPPPRSRDCRVGSTTGPTKIEELSWTLEAGRNGTLVPTPHLRLVNLAGPSPAAPGAAPHHSNTMTYVAVAGGILVLTTTVILWRRSVNRAARVAAAQAERDAANRNIGFRQAVESGAAAPKPQVLTDIPRTVNAQAMGVPGAPANAPIAGVLPRSVITNDTYIIHYGGSMYVTQLDPFTNQMAFFLVDPYLTSPYFFPGSYWATNGWSVFSEPPLYMYNNGWASALPVGMEPAGFLPRPFEGLPTELRPMEGGGFEPMVMTSTAEESLGAGFERSVAEAVPAASVDDALTGAGFGDVAELGSRDNFGRAEPAAASGLEAAPEGTNVAGFEGLPEPIETARAEPQQAYEPQASEPVYEAPRQEQPAYEPPPVREEPVQQAYDPGPPAAYDAGPAPDPGGGGYNDAGAIALMTGAAGGTGYLMTRPAQAAPAPVPLR